MEYWQDDDTFLSRWLNDELSEEEKLRFESSEAGQEFVKMMQASTLLKAPSYDVEAGLSQLKDAITTENDVPVRPLYQRPAIWMAIAASLVLIVVASVLLSDADTEIYAGIGQQELAVLPDGSKAQLNSNSTITYDEENWQQERRLQLEGEAFFEVKKGSKFTVNTAIGDVSVLGTSFNVKQRGDELLVACYTGKVKVVSGDFDTVLTPGKIAKITSDGKARVFDFESEETPSWINGITTLDETPFKMVLEELENVYGLDIQYDGAYDTIIYTGGFPNNNAGNAIKLVLDPLNIRYAFDQKSQSLTILNED